MDLGRLSYAMRAAADVARAGENLLVSIDRSRRSGLAPLALGVALGVGIGALVFREDARKRVLAWAGLTITPARAANGAAAAPRAASSEADVEARA